MEQKIKFSFNGDENGCLSILKTTFILFNGQEIEAGNERKSFDPGTVEQVKQFAPELYPMYKALCETTEIISRWEVYKQEMEKSAE